MVLYREKEVTQGRRGLPACPPLSLPLSLPPSPAYYYLLLLRPSSSASYSPCPERHYCHCCHRAGHYASASLRVPPPSAADTVTVLTSFARGVDPKVKLVTGAGGSRRG